MEGFIKGFTMSLNSIQTLQNLVKPHQPKPQNLQEAPVEKLEKTEEVQTHSETNVDSSIVTMGEVVNGIHDRINERIQESLKSNDYFVTSEFRKMREHLETLLEKTNIPSADFFSIGMNMQWEVNSDQGEQDFRFFMDVSYKVFNENSYELNRSYLDGASSVVTQQSRDQFNAFLEMNFHALEMKASQSSIVQVNNIVSEKPEEMPADVEKIGAFFEEQTGVSLS